MEAIVRAFGVLASAPALTDIGHFAQTFASIVAGFIALLGVPLALRQVVNLQRELRRYEEAATRRLDAETNVNLTAHYSLTRPAHELGEGDPHDAQGRRAARGDIAPTPAPVPEPGTRVLRLDLTLENVGEGTVDVLACLVAARELERQGEGVISAGRDAQWDDLTAHYWDADPLTSRSPGLSTTKHIVYAQDALARIKARGHKTLSRIDQVREQNGEGDVYLLYRIFVALRRSSRSTEAVENWTALQRALLNVNAPAFRSAAGEHDPLGLVANPDGWRLFLGHYDALADPKLAQLRRTADREEDAIGDPADRARAAERNSTELRQYCERVLLPGWRRFRQDYDRMAAKGGSFETLLADGGFRRRQRAVERHFPWLSQEVWTEYFYVTLQDDD
jgi:hypothetical protein